jgi:hypothetical protein
MKNWNIEKPKSFEEVIPKLQEFLGYCENKKKPRNNEILQTIKDCVSVMEGKFQEEVRERDKIYEARERDRELQKLLKKGKKKESKK